MHSVNELVVALDIGTRSVICVVSAVEDGMLRILDIERMEHEGRSVIDGQIEDISKVSHVIGAVISRLEGRLGFKLTNVCVAAAGRSLITKTASFDLSLDNKTPINHQMVTSMEMGAIEAARLSLAEPRDDSSPDYRCVGHSVIRYHLDDYPLNTLIGHRGNKARVDIIATFLPDEVVTTLYDTVTLAGLRVASLTLEPIAAMNLVVPRELRMLNLALVDIGAGTADIAISKEGTTTAYAMVTVAGDEITEAISKVLLTDFPSSERIKHAISVDDQIEYENILGMTYTVSSEKVRDQIRPAVLSLGREICNKIIEINAEPPAAVFLVGGGSYTPELGKQISEMLDLEPDKIAIGGGNYLKRSIVSDIPVSSPDLATPLGIAVTAGLGLGGDSFFVYVNGIKTILFNRELSTVMDALLMAGYRHDNLIARSGTSLTFTLDGSKTTVRGGLPTVAEIKLNNKPVTTAALINHDDRIDFIPATPGADASVTVRQIIKSAGDAYVLYKDRPVPIKLAVKIDGKHAPLKTEISEGDTATTYSRTNLRKLAESLDIDVNTHRLYINGGARDPNSELRHMDEVDFLPNQPIGS